MDTHPNRQRAVALIGASNNPSRYAYLALQMLEDYGHTVHLVSPRIESIEGRPVYPDIATLRSVHSDVDTVTMYVSSLLSSRMGAELLALAPRRVIFNPGAENLELRDLLTTRTIETLDACTLVLLRTGQF